MAAEQGPDNSKNGKIQPNTMGTEARGSTRITLGGDSETSSDTTIGPSANAQKINPKTKTINMQTCWIDLLKKDRLIEVSKDTNSN